MNPNSLVQFLANQLRAAGEGRYGDSVKSAYWWVSRHALQIGALLGLVDYLLLVAYSQGWCGEDCLRWDSYLVWGALLFAQAGLVTGFHRAPWPEPPATRTDLSGPQPRILPPGDVYHVDPKYPSELPAAMPPTEGPKT